MRNIKVSEKFNQLVTRLAKRKDTGDSEGAVFSDMAAVVTFAAAYGFRQNYKVSLGNQEKTFAIDSRVFDSRRYFFDIMYVNDQGSINALKEENEESAIKLFEDYCHGGLMKLKQLIDENGIENLKDIIQELINQNLIDNENKSTNL